MNGWSPWHYIVVGVVLLVIGAASGLFATGALAMFRGGWTTYGCLGLGTILTAFGVYRLLRPV